MAIITSNTREVFSNVKGRGMTIKADGKAFKIFFSGMYSNKPESITREIWSNAYDAHIQAGIPDRPFEVSFPSWLDASFRCRDFGPGLSPEFMMDGYCIVFHSEKDRSNDQVGGFGMGRLSPFSYVDSYSVTSWYKGIEYQYSCHLDQEGIPTVSLLFSHPSDKPSGLQVSFPLHKNEVSLFEAAAKKVSLGFDIKPVVTNRTNFEWPEYEVVIEGDGYKVLGGLSSMEQPHLSKLVAKMGCVLYPIPSTYHHKLIRPYAGNSQKIIFEFPIGSLQPTASREELSFGINEPTHESITDAIEKFNVEITQQVINQLESKKTILEKVIFYTHCSITIKDYEYLKTYYRDKYQGLYVRVSNYDLNYRKTFVYNPHSPYNINDKYTVYIEKCFTDTNSKKDTYTCEKIKENQKGNGAAIWIKIKEDSDKSKIDSLLTDLEGCDIIYISDLPKITRSRKKGTPVKVYKYNKNTTNNTEEVTITNINSSDNYLKMDNNVKELERKHIEFLLKANLIKEPIYIVPKTNWKRFKDAIDIKTIWDGLDKVKYQTHSDKYQYVHNELYIPINFNCPLLSELDTIIKQQKELVDGLTVEDCRSAFPPNVDDSYHHLLVKIQKKYPLLRHVPDLKHLKAYINMVIENEI